MVDFIINVTHIGFWNIYLIEFHSHDLINLVFIIFDVLIFVKMHNFLRHGSYLYVIEDINNPYLELGLGVLELVISTIVENDDKLMFPTDIKTKF